MSDQKYNSPEDPYFEDAQADEFEEEELISKTELKRQARELHKLGETLVNLTDAHIATIPMDEELADAVASLPIGNIPWVSMLASSTT